MPKTNQTDKKIIAIFKLIEYFLEGREINKYDPILLDEFQCSYKTLERYLNDLEQNYSNIITIKRTNKNYYKLVRVSNIITEFLKLKNSNTSIIFEWLKDDYATLKELEDETKRALEKISKSQREIFIFKNYPFEEFNSPKHQAIFNDLKEAVKKSEYRDMVFIYDGEKNYKDAKCLKLIFVDNNWYVAIENEDDKLEFLRISFVQSVKKTRDFSFQKSVYVKYTDFFKTFQNSLTLYGVQRQKALLVASPQIAKYFEKDMKKFFNSQEFIEKKSDGSILFSLLYTQPLEILPFIKKWLPDIKIVSPQSLKVRFQEDLKKALT